MGTGHFDSSSMSQNDLSPLTHSIKTTAAEYRYRNYDPAVVSRDYEAVTKELMEFQMSLDRYNQVELIDIEI